MDDSFTTQQLLVRRRITRALANHLARELNEHLATLAPLLAPRSVFGSHVRGGSGSASKGADEALEKLTAEYAGMYQSKPFNLRSRFDPPIEILSATPSITPSEYDRVVDGDAGRKQIRVVAPFRWVLSYDGFGPQQLSTLIARGGSAADAQLQQCVLHQLALFVVMSRRQGIRNLLGALRFPVSFEQHDQFGKLPLVLIGCPLSTFLPSDEVVLESTELSGTSQFEEVVDLKQLAALQDPLKERIVSLIGEHGETQTGP